MTQWTAEQLQAAYSWGREFNRPTDADFALFGIDRGGRKGFDYYPEQGIITTPAGAAVPAPTSKELDEWAKGPANA